jgi:hypothetical protein
MTGIGPVAVRQPCVRDREAAAGIPVAFVSHLRFFVAQEISICAAFMSMAAVIGLGALLVWFKLGETKTTEYSEPAHSRAGDAWTQ